jgi:ribosomal-protein-alanine N-acetyltransferase
VTAVTTVLRAAVPGDVAAVHALEEQLFGSDAWSAAVVADALAAPSAGRHAVVAEAGDRVVGYAVLRVAGDVADLDRIAVDPGHRRDGLATALLRAVGDASREAGADRLLLEVSEGNTGARAFYAARGAVELDRRRRYYRDGSDALVLQLPIAHGAEVDRD